MMVAVLEVLVVCVLQTFGLSLWLVCSVHTVKVELTSCDYACLIKHHVINVYEWVLGIASHVFNLALGGNWSAFCPSQFVSCQKASGSCWIYGWMDPRNWWPLAFSAEEYVLCWCSTLGLPISAHYCLSNLTCACKILRLVHFCLGETSPSLTWDLCCLKRQGFSITKKTRESGRWKFLQLSAKR